MGKYIIRFEPRYSDLTVLYTYGYAYSVNLYFVVKIYYELFLFSNVQTLET